MPSLLNILTALSFLTLVLSCRTDSDCSRLSVCISEECEHKDLFPMSITEYLGVILVILLAGLSNAGGIGGGAIMMPILILLFGFVPHYAIPISQVIIFGGSLIAIVMKLPSRHPTRDKPLIFYDLILLTTSPLLLGISTGVMLNEIFPSWIIELLLTIVLAYMTFNTSKKGKKLFEKETSDKIINQEKLLEAEPEEDDREGPKTTPQIQNMKEVSINSEPQDIQEAGMNEVSDGLKAVLRAEKKMFPIKIMMFIVLNWLFVILITFMKGDSAMESIVGIHKCTGAWAGLLVVFALACIGLNIFAGYLCVKSTEVKQRLNYDWDEYDLRWTNRTAVIVSSTALLAGVLAGMLGFGGGLIMGPLMLNLGVRPEQSAATSSFMILFTSSIAVLQYSAANRVNIQYGILLLFSAFIGSASGIFIVKKLVDKYKRPSFVVFTLAIVLGLAGIIIPVYGISSIVKSYNNGTGNFGFKDLCTV